MSTQLTMQQRSIVDELLDGVHASKTVEELDLHLRTATGYVTGLLALASADCMLVLHSYGEGSPAKIAVIKALRATVPGVGLRQAKTLVESAPVALCARDNPLAHELLESLSRAGASLEFTSDHSHLPAADWSQNP